MALKATVYRLTLDVADIDRGYYASHALTLARHPSETEERLMLRVLAFALHADPALEFGRGISTAEDPDLWLRNDDGTIRLWIDLGLPDERALRRAAGRARQVVVIAHGGRGAIELWLERNRAALARLHALRVLAIDADTARALAELADRAMQLQCTIQDGHALFTAGDRTVLVEPRVLHGDH
jgi:uncharacterized protein YaeQ